MLSIVAGRSPTPGAVRLPQARCGAKERTRTTYQARARKKKGEDSRAVGSGRGPARGFGGAAAKAERWQCARGCGACCKLDKGPAFPSPEEIFHDDPHHLQLYRSLIGPDGWCIHYEHTTRTCSIYQDRPFFCRVEPQVFLKLFGIEERRFHREACSSCKDTISAVYGRGSEELRNFDRLTRKAN